MEAIALLQHQGNKYCDKITIIYPNNELLNIFVEPGMQNMRHAKAN